MAEASTPRKRGPIQFSTNIFRVELGATRADHDDLNWDVTYRPVDRKPDASNPNTVTVAIGMLRVRTAATMARVVVGGFLRVDDHLVPPGESAAEYYLPGFVEEMWDAGRRTLNSVAAAMDAPNLNLPVQSPPVQIQQAGPPLREPDTQESLPEG